MSFWSWIFKSSKQVQIEPNKTIAVNPSITEGKEDPVKKDNVSTPDSNQITIVDYGTHMPIDIIYGSLRTNHEQRGYNDAMCSPDISYKELNLNLIKNDLIVKIRQVKLNYKKGLSDIDFHIESRSQAGLVDTVNELEKQKEIFLEHLELLNKMETDYQNNESYMIGSLLSYERGFMRGLAAKSMEMIESKKNQLK